MAARIVLLRIPWYENANILVQIGSQQSSNLQGRLFAVQVMPALFPLARRGC